MTDCPHRDQNWETLSTRETGFNREKISSLVGHIVSAHA
jgi:hypothetical protein